MSKTILKKKKPEEVVKAPETIKEKKETAVKDTKVKGPPAPSTKLKRKDVFDVGDILNITNRSGVTFTGKLKGYVQGSYYLVDVEFSGKEYRVKAPWVLVEMNTVSHICPGDSELKRLNNN